MKRSFLVIAVVAAAGFLIGIPLYSWSHQAPAKRIIQGEDTLDLWPVSKSWVWRVDPVATKKKVGLCVRTTESKLQPRESPSFPFFPKVPPKGGEGNGWIILDRQRVSGLVTCQVVDLQEIGLEGDPGKKPLRLLYRLRAGGGGLSKPMALTGSFVGANCAVDPRWVGDEMHLLTVYTQMDNTFFAHYVILRQSDDE